MAFSLSPSVDVVEYDLSLTIPNLPSSKTGMVVRADTGPALQIVPIASENDLVKQFGKPTNANYEDWYQAWNFLQYASSLYCVRPMDDSVKNAGISLNGGDATTPVTKAAEHLAGLYNEEIAEISLDGYPGGDKLVIWNRYVTSQQNLAVAVCSSDATWHMPVARPAHSFTAADYAALQLTTGYTDDDVGKLAKVDDTDAYYVLVSQTGGDPTWDAFTNWAYNSLGQLVDNTKDPSTLVPETQTFDSSVQAGANIIHFSKFFDYKPDFAKGEFALIVFEKDADGLYAPADNEAYIVSWKENGRDAFGRNIYVEDKIFNASSKIYVDTDPSVTTLVETAASPVVTIEHAVDNSTVYPLDALTSTNYDPYNYKQADVLAAENLFSSAEDFDVNILVAHPLDINGMSTIAETRKDALAIVPLYGYDNYVGQTASEATDNVMKAMGTGLENDGDPVNGVDAFTAFGTYSSCYGNMKYQYDKFNDVNRWMPVGGDIAGLMAVTDSTRDPWWAVAGLERGKIKNAIKLAFNPRKAHRDRMYPASINPIISIPGEGAAVVWGQKTSTAKPSAFDRVNVRRLLITLEKAVATATKYALFEFNDEFTRARIVGMIEPFLRDVKGRRGLYDFLVVCDNSNNTPEVIDRNELVVDVYLKPTRVAEFIRINMRVTRTDADFTELVGAAA